MGGHAEELGDVLRDRYQPGWDLESAVRTAVQALATTPETREVPAEQIEAGVLDRTRTQRRKFRRLTKEQLVDILAP
jgi:proteasome alpha subunit